MSNERILVIKLGALGDFMYAIGAMRAVRDHHPQAHITLLTREPYVDLANKTGFFDKVILDPRPKYNPLDWLAFRKFLNAARFSRAYDLQNNDRSEKYFKLFSPKPEWVGIALGASHRNADSERKKFHAFLGLKKNLELAGITTTRLDDLSWISADITRFSIPRPFALLVPGSALSRLNKRWPAENFRKLVTALSAEGIHTVLLGSKDEKSLNASIAKGTQVTDLSGLTRLEDIPELARNASIAIGNDTGPMHIISMAGCPSIFFYRRDQSTVLKHGPQAENTFAYEENLLENIQPDQVTAKIKEMIRR